MATAIEQTSPTMRPQEAIRRTLEQYAHAVRRKSLDALGELYAPDFEAFDAVPPLRVGAKAYRKNWELWFASFEGTPVYEMHDLVVTAGEDVGFARAVVEMGSPGEGTRAFMRWTVGLRRSRGTWLIVHEHISAPFDMDSFEAKIDLRP